MKAPIIKRRTSTLEVTYMYRIRAKNGEGGFSFPCNDYGVLSNPADVEKLVEKLGTGKYHDDGIQEFERIVTDPAILRCSCGSQVTLHRFTNTCRECHTDYNMSGDALVDRKYWGEETGEALDEILAADAMLNPLED